MEADYMFVDIRATKYYVLYVADAGRVYSEATITTTRSGRIATVKMKISWILTYGTP